MVLNKPWSRWRNGRLRSKPIVAKIRFTLRSHTGSVLAPKLENLNNYWLWEPNWLQGKKLLADSGFRLCSTREGLKDRAKGRRKFALDGHGGHDCKEKNHCFSSSLPRLNELLTLIANKTSSSAYLWHCAWRKLNSSRILSIDSSMFSLNPAWPGGPPGTCCAKTKISYNKNSLLIRLL